MSYSYETKKKTAPGREADGESSAVGPSLDALRSGAAKATSEQMGRRVDLPDAMRSKMESAFGADLSAVKLYESQTVADAGANAVTQGSNIAFAPGMLDFSSFGGQALLGHEISHVVSQARGEVTGGGFLNNRALEARADREGAAAAAGQTVAMPTAAMSSFSAAPAAGPMQASKPDKKEKTKGQLFDETLLRAGGYQSKANSIRLDNADKVRSWSDSRKWTDPVKLKYYDWRAEREKKKAEKMRSSMTPEEWHQLS